MNNDRVEALDATVLAEGELTGESVHAILTQDERQEYGDADDLFAWDDETWAARHDPERLQALLDERARRRNEKQDERDQYHDAIDKLNWW
jgi:hypothetical protein